METENLNTLGYRDLIGRLFRDFGGLAKSEAALMGAEARDLAPRLTRHLLLLGASSFLLAVSVLPLVAFAVIGLGDLLGNYWLSSLIVGAAGICLSGSLVFFLLKRIRSEDLGMLRSAKAIRSSTEAILGEVREFKSRTEDLPGRISGRE